MTRFAIPLLTAVLCAGCAGSPVQQPEPPPQRVPEPSRVPPGSRTPTNDDATQRWLDEKTRTSQGPHEVEKVRGRTPTDEAATQEWLAREQERRRYVPPAPPPPRIIERVVVETPAYPYGYERQRYESPFPYYTAFGAGLGAAIGSASHEAGEGAAIGAGVGLVLDLFRWH